MGRKLLIDDPDEEQAQGARRWRLFFEHARDAILVCSAEAHILDANESACELLEYTYDELLEMTLDQLVSPEHALRLADVLEEIIAKGKLLLKSLYVSKHGKPIPVETSASAISIDGETLVQLVSRDITQRQQERQQLEARARRLAAKVEETQQKALHNERLAAIGQLATSVSHELRNPLGVLNNSVYFLSMILPQDDERIVKHLRIMKREIEECRRIVDELLDFSREPRLELQVVPLVSLIDAALERIDWPKTIRVEKVSNMEEISVRVDRQRFIQVLVNLLQNAIQAMPEGGVIRIRTRTRAEEIAIQIEDEGVGIPPDRLSRIFEPLFTTKPRGIGLGLALSKRLIEAQGGRIGVESVPNKGSTFTITLPLELTGT